MIRAVFLLEHISYGNAHAYVFFALLLSFNDDPMTIELLLLEKEMHKYKYKYKYKDKIN